MTATAIPPLPRKLGEESSVVETVRGAGHANVARP